MTVLITAMQAPPVLPATSPVPSSDTVAVTIGSCWLAPLEADGDLHECTVLESRHGNDGHDYYVHFNHLDRRHDTWIHHTLIRPLPTPTATTSDSTNGSANGSAAVTPSSSASSRSPPLTRRHKRRLADPSHVAPAHADDTLDGALEAEHFEKTKIKYIRNLRLQTPPTRSRPAPTVIDIDCWYYSPYPHAVRYSPVLYSCGFCLSYYQHSMALQQHLTTCTAHHPPGNEIYRDELVSVWEVDGMKQRLYCSSLSLLAKLFIDHKTAVYDVEPFLFYILTRHYDNGDEIVGYFSKEKHSVEGNNVACILVFPHCQRSGYGRFLIEISYELSRIEGRIGSPEKPLSDLGRVSYMSYWSTILLSHLHQMTRSLTGGDGISFSVDEMSLQCQIKRDDCLLVLREWDIVRYVKGQHVIQMTKANIEQIMARRETERLARRMNGEQNNSQQTKQSVNGGAAGADELEHVRCQFKPTLLQWSPPVFLKDKRLSTSK